MRHPRLRLTVLATLGAVLLGGCSLRSDRAEIMVGTTPPGASCILSRGGQPIATAEPTPAIALVEPSDAEVAILCRRRGFQDTAVALVARQVEPSFDLLFGLPPENQHHVEIALVPR